MDKSFQHGYHTPSLGVLIVKTYFSTILTHFDDRYIIIFQKIEENSLFPDIVFICEKRYHICRAAPIGHSGTGKIFSEGVKT